jgi:quercetin dioxygenase-like cupin family protein
LIRSSIRPRVPVALVALLLGSSAPAADGPAQGPYGSVKELLRTGTSTIGEPLRYPVGTPSVRTVVVTLAPGETTAKHHHDAPVFIYMLEGEVSVDYEGHGKKVYRAGDAFMEAMASPHAATNVGKTPVRILATFLETAGSH